MSLPREVLLVFITLLLIESAFGQTASGLTEANACRHTAVLARDNTDTSHSTRCHIGAKVIKSTSSMAEIVEGEWSWIYKNIKSLTGQVVSKETQRRKLFTQIECNDPGAAIGRWARSYYKTPGNDSRPEGIMEDLGGKGGIGDAYKDCVTTDLRQEDIAFYPGANSSARVDSVGTLKKYVRLHSGEHVGTGDELKEFDFTYSQMDLRTAIFRDLERAVTQGEQTQSSKVVQVHGFPYETGLTVVAQTKGEIPLLRDINQDLSVLGWNRLLEAESALAGRRSPPIDGPPAVDTPQACLNVLVVFLAIVTLRQTWRTIQEQRQVRAREWAKMVCIENTVLICSRKEQQSPSAYLVATSAEVLTVLGLLVSAIGAIVLSANTFWNSNLIDRDLVVVNQGGVITYEGTVGQLREDPKNVLAGVLFTVGHWMTIELEESGHVVWRAIIVLAHGLLALWIWSSVSMVAHSLEHKYDSWILQRMTAPVRWIHRSWRSALIRVVPLLKKRFKYGSYISTVRSLCNELPHSTGFKISILENCRRQRWRLGRLIPEPRDDPKKDLLEKCAVVMTDYRWGLLDFSQALYLHTNQIALTALKRWTSSGSLPDRREATQIACAHYVMGVLTANGAGGGEALIGDSMDVEPLTVFPVDEEVKEVDEISFAKRDEFLVVDLRGEESSLRGICDGKSNRLENRSPRACSAYKDGKLPRWFSVGVNETGDVAV